MYLSFFTISQNNSQSAFQPLPEVTLVKRGAMVTVQQKTEEGLGSSRGSTAGNLSSRDKMLFISESSHFIIDTDESKTKAITWKPVIFYEISDQKYFLSCH